MVRTESKRGDLGILINKSQEAISEFRNFLITGMNKALHCEGIVSTQVALMDHMVREMEKNRRGGSSG